MWRRIVLFATVFIAILCGSVPVFAAGNRLALIIANSNYGLKNPAFKGLNLSGPAQDAERMKAALEGADFDVIVVRDVTKAQVEEKVLEFKLRLEAIGQAGLDAGKEPDAVAFFYYSGHGAADSTLRGENYLLPIPETAWIRRPEELDKRAVSLKTITDALYASEPRPAFSFVVIDACRDIAFKPVAAGAVDADVVSRSFVGVQREAPENMLIAYATGENQTADDQNYYSKALAESISRPGLEARRVFIEATQAVRRQTESTGRLQVPIYKDRLVNDFFFTQQGQFTVASKSDAAAKPDVPEETQSTDDTSSQRPGSSEGIYTGFSGFLADRPGAIDPKGEVIGSVDLVGKNQVRVAQKGTGSPSPHVTAGDIGQVFGITADLGSNTPGSAPRPPNIYLAATSVYGLPTDHMAVASAGSQAADQNHGPASWAKGLFGSEKGGGPGSIWVRNGETGDISLFANVSSGGAMNSGPALGQLAFDPRTRQVFVSDLDTGLIHRLNMKGADLGTFDHGLEGRPKLKDAKAAPDDASSRADPNSPQFNAYDASTWGLTDTRRRVWGLAVRGARLFYGVTDGPEVWSVGINIDGTFSADSLLEFAVIGAAAGSQIAKIEFDPKGNLYLGLLQGMMALAFDSKSSDVPRPASSTILRYKPQPGGVKWNEHPEIISAAGAERDQILGAGFSLGYGLTGTGDVDARACAGSLWATAWRPSSGATAAARALLGWTGSHLSLSSLAPNQSPDIDWPQGSQTSPLGGILAIAPCDNPQEVGGLMTHPGKRPKILPPAPAVVASADLPGMTLPIPADRPLDPRPIQPSTGTIPPANPQRPDTPVGVPSGQSPGTTANALPSPSSDAVKAKPEDVTARPHERPATPDTTATAPQPAEPANPSVPKDVASATLKDRPGEPVASNSAPQTAPPDRPEKTFSSGTPSDPGTLHDHPARDPASPKDIASTDPHKPPPGSTDAPNTDPVAFDDSVKLPPCMKLQAAKFQCVANAWELDLNLTDTAGKDLDALKVSPLAIDSIVEPGIQKRALANDPFRVRFDNTASGSEVRFDVCLFDEASSRNGQLYRCCRAEIKVDLPAVPCNKPVDQ